MTGFNKMKNDMQFKQAKISLLFIIIFSAVNLFTIIFGDLYFLFSSYITTLFAYMGYAWYVEGAIAVAFVFIAIGIISLVPYILCYIFAKKHVGWLIGALVLFSIDSVLVLIDFVSLILIGDISMLIDVLFHAYAIYALAVAIKYGYKVKEDKEAPIEEDTYIPTEYSEEMAQVTRKLVIERKKAFTSIGTILICYIDGKEVCRLKNGASATVTVDGNPHKFDVLEPQSYKSASVEIREGYGTKNILLTAKAAYRGVTPFIEMN